MRTLALIDLKIDKQAALDMLKEYGDFYEQQTSVKCTFWVERRDFSIVPTQPDSDGDLKPTFAYRQGLAADVHRRYADYGTDNILMWVHEDNFLFKGVWGTAWAYQHFKYNFLLCRWDKDNPVNTFNTLFHEDMHPADMMIRQELGIDINPLIRTWILAGNMTKADIAYVQANGFNWDRDFVHGALPSAPYIGERGYKLTAANLRLLKYIAPYLARAYQAREDKHFKEVNSLQWKVIQLAREKIAKLTK